MPSFESIQRMIDVSADAHSVSQYVAYTQETVDSGTKNKLWSFRSVLWLANITFFPLVNLLSLNVWLVYCATALPLATLFYVASVLHKNQIIQNEGYDLALMSSLDGDLTSAKDGVVYLSTHPKAYFLKGMNQAIFFTEEVDLTALEENLHDFDFKKMISALVSNDGYMKVKELPWGLHDNEYIKKIVPFLSDNLVYPLFALYAVSLAACFIFGSPWYACISLAMYGLDQLYQREYLPELLEMPYLCLSISILLLVIFGVTSYIGIGFSLVMVVFTVIDHVLCNKLGQTSPTVQFPNNNASEEYDFELMSSLEVENTKILDNVVYLSENRKAYFVKGMQKEAYFSEDVDLTNLVKKLADINFKKYILGITLKAGHTRNNNPVETFECRLKTHQEKRGARKLHVTFDHFYESYQLVEDILKDVPFVFPERGYMRYLDLFAEIYFKDEKIRDFILCQMYAHEKFNAQDLKGLLKEQLIERQITYLKQEMEVFVGRLDQASHRDFSHLQAANMHGYARLLLSKMEAYSPGERADLLLAIAMTTGSHCYRSYPQNLSDFAAEKKILFSPDLTLRNRAMLVAQDIREAAFRTYYYNTVRVFNKYFYFNIIWGDIEDYFTYEDFVYWFGLNFYLRNVSFTLGFREASEVLWDRAVAFFFQGDKLLFRENYTVDFLVEQAVNPEEKLYPIFADWCVEKNINIWDEDQLIKYKSDPNELRALAEFMLLDLKIIDVKKPTVSRYALFQPASLPRNIEEQSVLKSISMV
jgi:hypothetical protein